MVHDTPDLKPNMLLARPWRPVWRRVHWLWRRVTATSGTKRARPFAYGLAVGVMVLCTLIGLPLRDLTEADNLAMIYLTGVVVVAARLGLGPSMLASAVSVVAFNLVFTKPYYSLSFTDPHYLVTFAVMLVTSLVVGSMTAQLSRHLNEVNTREHEVHRLYDLTRALSAVRGVDRMCAVAIQYLSGPFDLGVTVFVIGQGGLEVFPEDAVRADLKAMGAVEWVLANHRIAGRDTDTLPSAAGLYLPLSAETEMLGVLGFTPRDPARHFTGAEVLQFETFASLVAGALQRARRADEAESSRVDSENEKLRNVLLSSLSHDLRTPLTVMNGSVSSLLRMRKDLPRKAVDELTGVWTQLNRLQKFVGNLLDMAALTSGRMKLNLQPYTIQEIIGAALSHVQAGREQRTLRTQINGALPMAMIDGALIEQVFVNLIENAYQHTASDGDVLVRVEKDADTLRIAVSDNGDGLREGEETRIFEQFQTGQTVSSDRSGGTGLGLAICRGIVQAHGGMIYARNNRAADNGRPSGASFIFTLPIAKDLP